jgi:hypothetical protein
VSRVKLSRLINLDFLSGTALGTPSRDSSTVSLILLSGVWVSAGISGPYLLTTLNSTLSTVLLRWTH